MLRLGPRLARGKCPQELANVARPCALHARGLATKRPMTRFVQVRLPAACCCVRALRVRARPADHAPPHCPRRQARSLSAHAAPVRQYPFDKTKMAEVTAWSKEADLASKIRAMPGVRDIEVSFCPGEGWLASRFIFDDLEDMKAYLGSDAIGEFKKTMSGAPHYDASREPHEFKGFLQEQL